MESLRKPDLLSFGGNVAENWRRFVLEFDIYVECLTNLNERQKAMMLLNLAGQVAMKRERSFVYRPEVRNQNKFSEICTPRRNITMERHAFHSRVMQSGESFQDFLGDLRVKASTCEFVALEEEMIRDRTVTGHNNNGV